MAPFRASRSTRSGPTRGQTDNDTLDGLPIRQWRKLDSVIGAIDFSNNATDAPSRGVGIWKELPMPEGSNNYPFYSQQILRAARAGNILRSQEIIRNLYRKNEGEDEKDAEAEDGADGANEEVKRGIKRNAQGFQVKKWSQLTRQQEVSFPEYLAPRRAGLPSFHHIPDVNPSNMRHTKVRRVDATNQPVIYEILVAEGKVVDGEVTEALQGDDELVVKPAPGTLIEGLGVANEHGVIVLAEAPVPLFGRGRAPPPRRKGKRGPGRGRKKVDFGDTNTITIADGMATTTSRLANGGGDLIMGDATEGDGVATPAAGEEDGEDGEDGEDDEDDEGDGDGDGDGEGEDKEADADAEGEHDDDREEGELTPSSGPDSQDASQVLQQFQAPAVQLPPQPEETLPTIVEPPEPSQVEQPAELPQLQQEPLQSSGNVSDQEQNGAPAEEPSPQPIGSAAEVPLPQPIEPAAVEQPLPPIEPLAPRPLPQQVQQPVVPPTQEPFRIPGLSLTAPPVPESAPLSAPPPNPLPVSPHPEAAVNEPESGALASLDRKPQDADDEREEGEIE